MMRFGWMDVIVSVGCATAILGVGVAARHQAQEFGVIIDCQQNLRQIAQSLVMYEGTYNGQFPRTRYTPDAPLTAYTAPDAKSPFAPDGPAANDTTASMWLLAREMELPRETFICPAAQRHGLAEPDRFDRLSAKGRSNFRARVNDNYSLANMYPSTAAVKAGYSLESFHEKLPPTFAIAADTNPGIKDEKSATTQETRLEVREMNSPNHQRDGQNILFADGSVAFFGSPFAGRSDNAYRADDGGVQPTSATDSVLLPVWSEGPQKTPLVVLGRRWTLGIAAVGVTIGMVLLIRRGVKRARHNASHNLP